MMVLPEPLTTLVDTLGLLEPVTTLFDMVGQPEPVTTRVDMDEYLQFILAAIQADKYQIRGETHSHRYLHLTDQTFTRILQVWPNTVTNNC
jgi:hypothetical protein